MAFAYVFGKTLVSADEMGEKLALGTLADFAANAKKDPAAKLRFRAGEIQAKDLAQAETPAFSPIGLGKPLSVEILSVYVGHTPRKRLFGGDPDLLVASAVKSVVVADVAPRAINQIVSKVPDRDLRVPSAMQQGSPIVYYSPSLSTGTTLVSLELAVDTFDKDLIDSVAGLVPYAAAIPVFAPAAAALFVAGKLIKLASPLAKSLLQADPVLRSDMSVRLDTPGIPVSLAKQVVLYNAGRDQEFAEYELSILTPNDSGPRAVLVHHATQARYNGPEPYVVLSVDGRERTELNAFQPTHAAAAVLDKFYGKEPVGQAIELVQSALSLYSDMAFRKRAENMKSQLDKLQDKDSDEYKGALKLYNAYRANIQESALQLPEIK